MSIADMYGFKKKIMIPFGKTCWK